MAENMRIKKGETFLLYGQYVEDDGVTPKSLAGVTLSSQVRDKTDKLLSDLVITITDEASGTFTVSTTLDNETNLWTEGHVYWDLKKTVDGVTSITDTAIIQVNKAITIS